MRRTPLKKQSPETFKVDKSVCPRCEGRGYYTTVTWYEGGGFDRHTVRCTHRIKKP